MRIPNSSRWTSSILLPVILTGGLYAQSLGTGSISGAIKTVDGRVVTAEISAHKANPYPPAATVRVTTGTGGTFQIGGLASGPWELCATVNGYIDPCLWEPSGTLVTVQPGKTISGVTLPLKKASTLHIRINDPASLVPSAATLVPIGGPTPSAFLVMGVFASGGRFYPVRQTGADALGKDHEISVPFDKPFRFMMRAIGLSVADDKNSTIAPSGISLPLLHSSSSPPAALTFNVKGRL